MHSVNTQQFRGGEILDRNFDTYEITQFGRVPRIEAVLAKNDKLAPRGGGEQAITTIDGALAMLYLMLQGYGFAVYL